MTGLPVRVVEYVNRHPDATVAQVLGRWRLDPNEHRSEIAALLADAPTARVSPVGEIAQ